MVNLTVPLDGAALERKRMFPEPRIGVLGATDMPDVYRAAAQDVGYWLSTYARLTGGSIVTGGVGGVGVAVYEGVAMACLDHAACSGGTIPDDRFFIAYPEYLDDRDREHGRGGQFRYPEAYDTIARSLGRNRVTGFVAGRNGSERRRLLAAGSTILIAINGSVGTDDEIQWAIHYDRPLIMLPHTGGSAWLITQITEATGKRYYSDPSIRDLMQRRDYIPARELFTAADGHDVVEHLEKLRARSPIPA